MKIERWVDRPEGEATPDDRIGALLRQVPDAPPLPPDRLARVAAGLRGSASGRRTWRQRWAVVAAVVVLGNTGLVFATREIVRWLGERTSAPATIPESTAPSRPARSLRAPTTTSPSPSPATLPSAPSPRPTEIETPALEKIWNGQEAKAAPRSPLTLSLSPRGGERGPGASSISKGETPRAVAGADGGSSTITAEAAPAPAATPAPSAIAPPRALAGGSPPPSAATHHPLPAAVNPLVVETELLGRALGRLRSGRDAAGALAELQEYGARFPEGRLRNEAAVARVDALLALGRRAEALGELRSMKLAEVGRADELRVIRGELSAPGDCRAAVADFDGVLARGGSRALQERALHGRAACRLRLGDTAGSEGDLRDYLRRFPDGRFAADVRRKLPPR